MVHMFSNEVTLMRKHTCHDWTIKCEKLAIDPATTMPPCSWLQPDCPSLQHPQFCQSTLLHNLPLQYITKCKTLVMTNKIPCHINRKAGLKSHSSPPEHMRLIWGPETPYFHLQLGLRTSFPPDLISNLTSIQPLMN